MLSFEFYPLIILFYHFDIGYLMYDIPMKNTIALTIKFTINFTIKSLVAFVMAHTKPIQFIIIHTTLTTALAIASTTLTIAHVPPIKRLKSYLYWHLSHLIYKES